MKHTLFSLRQMETYPHNCVCVLLIVTTIIRAFKLGELDVATRTYTILYIPDYVTLETHTSKISAPQTPNPLSSINVK